jgi:adenine deaminase
MDAPFMTLSFMALLVIPQLKLSDRGLFDGDAFHFVDRFVDG